jgi:hypothetical protein
MRSLWNNLGDPTLHLLATALILLYLALGGGSWPGETAAEAPLPYCKSCHAHYLPGKTCDCRSTANLAHALP